LQRDQNPEGVRQGEKARKRATGRQASAGTVDQAPDKSAGGGSCSRTIAAARLGRDHRDNAAGAQVMAQADAAPSSRRLE
jgi:hypothetical protein